MTRWAALLILIATPALAQETPRFCPNRPDLGSSACTTRPGEVQLEVSAADWQLDRTADTREDQWLFGDIIARFGVGPRTELQLSWTPYGRVRTRDTASGRVDTARGIGDVRVAMRQNVRNPGGDGFSWGLEPFATLPVGSEGVGAGDWGAGVVLPVSYDLGETVNLAFTGTAEALPDADGDGRHFSAAGILGLAIDVAATVTIVGEVSLQRDRDPAGHRTLALAAGSIAWQPSSTRQIDLLVAAGLNRDTPDVRIVAGGAFLF